MTEYMVATTQAISAAGVLVLAALTFSRRFTKALREEMRSDQFSLSGKIEILREEMRRDRDTLREEIRADRVAIFGEIKELRLEMHDMNGRLGRVEGHHGISASNS